MLLIFKVTLALKWDPAELEMYLVTMSGRSEGEQSQANYTVPLAQRWKEIEVSKDISGVGRMAGVLSLSEPSRPDPHPDLRDAALTPCLLVFPFCPRAS